MTKLKKKVKRELDIPSINKPVVIEVDPETKRLGFREKGCRRTFWLPIKTAYMMAVMSDEKEGK